MTLVLLTLQALLGCTFLVLAGWTFRSPAGRPWLGAVLPAGRWPRLGMAVACLLAGLAVFAGLAVPFLAFFSACLVLLLAVAMAAFALRSHQAGRWRLPALLASGAVALAALQPLGLKVLALPQAARLPVASASVEVIKTYPEGFWLEGIATDAQGMIYLSANRDLDFARADYFHRARGELLVRRPDGTESRLFATPVGMTAGVPVVADDGTVYLTSHGERSGVWRIARGQQPRLLAHLPRGAWPNGLCLGPDGQLYSADSALGVIWRIAPTTGAYSAAIADARLEARRFIALAPGANGLEFRGRELVVTVSDRTTVLGYTLRADGSFAPARRIATGIPGDDFAIGDDGALFITTHPYDTLVRVSATGERSVLAGAGQGIVGPTDAAFGRGPADAATLYVVTDGGAFTGGPATRGRLVAVRPN